MSNQPQILDLDKIIEDTRIVKLAGKEIDVSILPSRVTIELAANQSKMKESDNESFHMLVDMVVKVCQPSDPTITRDWIIDNTSFQQLLKLIEFILAPLNERAQATGKKEESPNQ